MHQKTHSGIDTPQSLQYTGLEKSHRYPPVVFKAHRTVERAEMEPKARAKAKDTPKERCKPNRGHPSHPRMVHYHWRHAGCTSKAQAFNGLQRACQAKAQPKALGAGHVEHGPRRRALLALYAQEPTPPS